MTATITTLDRANRNTQPANQSDGPISGEPYRFHGFRVFDSNGERVGIIDWVWTNDIQKVPAGEGAHIGVQLQWLRGKARAVPATWARVDRELSLVRLPYTKEQIFEAPRFRIDRALSSRDCLAIAEHFAPSTQRAGSRSHAAPLAA